MPSREQAVRSQALGCMRGGREATSPSLSLSLLVAKADSGRSSLMGVNQLPVLPAGRKMTSGKTRLSLLGFTSDPCTTGYLALLRPLYCSCPQ